MVPTVCALGDKLEKSPSEIAIVLFGRPYNALSSLGNLGIPRKFASRGFRIIPLDFLPAEHYADPIWDTVQMNGIAQHFAAAFLGRYLKEDAAMKAYLAPGFAGYHWIVQDTIINGNNILGFGGRV